MRRVLIAGNWKMNLDLREARALVAGIVDGLGEMGDAAAALDVAVCPPFPYLFPIAKAVAGTQVLFGAQNVYPEPSGAFTGEVSGGMIAESGARFVIVGHSERRHTIGRGEDDWLINRKLLAARGAGLTPILCVGETLAQRTAGQTLDVLTFQIAAGLAGFPLASAEDLVIAYEPVWAIGTGHNATPEQAEEAHAHIRARLRAAFGAVADAVRLLYGGSMKPDNAEALLRQPNVDGGLVGGASLKPDSFVGIIRGALAAQRPSG
jgi:triosephosphate isomerase